MRPSTGSFRRFPNQHRASATSPRRSAGDAPPSTRNSVVALSPHPLVGSLDTSCGRPSRAFAFTRRTVKRQDRVVWRHDRVVWRHHRVVWRP